MPFEIRGVPIVNAYIERDQEIRVMEEELCPGADCEERKVFVLHGLGGIGKTQLSLAYARKHQTAYTAVFWLNGQTHESIRRSIAGIVRQLPMTQISAFARSIPSKERSAGQDHRGSPWLVQQERKYQVAADC